MLMSFLILMCLGLPVNLCLLYMHLQMQEKPFGILRRLRLVLALLNSMLSSGKGTARIGPIITRRENNK